MNDTTTGTAQTRIPVARKLYVQFKQTSEFKGETREFVVNGNRGFGYIEGGFYRFEDNQNRQYTFAMADIKEMWSEVTAWATPSDVGMAKQSIAVSESY